MAAGKFGKPTGDARGEAISFRDRDRHHLVKVSTVDRQGNTDSKLWIHSGLEKKENENSVGYFRASLKG